MDEPPGWFDATPEAMKKALWQQKVILYLVRTQRPDRAQAIIVGYAEGDPGAVELFELASTRLSKRRMVPKA